MFEFFDNMNAMTIVDTCRDTGKKFIRIKHIRAEHYMGIEYMAEYPCQLFVYQNSESEETPSDKFTA
jgi:hypothetical protein